MPKKKKSDDGLFIPDITLPKNVRLDEDFTEHLPVEPKIAKAKKSAAEKWTVPETLELVTNAKNQPPNTRGRAFTDEEKRYIKRNLGILSYDEMATELVCPPRKIEAYVKKNNIPLPESAEEDLQKRAIAHKMRKEPFWRNMEKKYTREQRERFTEDWVAYCLQFNEDLKASEKDQLRQAIELSIAMDDILIVKMENETRVKNLEAEQEMLYHDPPGERDMVRVGHMEIQLQSARGAAISASEEWRKNQDKHSRLLAALNADRKARVEKMGDTKTTWPRLLEEIQANPIKKKQMGEIAYLYMLAFIKAKHQLTQPHKYADGNEDYPLLVAAEDRQIGAETSSGRKVPDGTASASVG
jgi:hypothetical protein